MTLANDTLFLEPLAYVAGDAAGRAAAAADVRTNWRRDCSTDVGSVSVWALMVSRATAERRSCGELGAKARADAASDMTANDLIAEGSASINHHTRF